MEFWYISSIRPSAAAGLWRTHTRRSQQSALTLIVHEYSVCWQAERHQNFRPWCVAHYRATVSDQGHADGASKVPAQVQGVPWHSWNYLNPSSSSTLLLTALSVKKKIASEKRCYSRSQDDNKTVRETFTSNKVFIWGRLNFVVWNGENEKQKMDAE